MTRLVGLVNSVLAALLMAASVTLLAVGLLSFRTPTAEPASAPAPPGAIATAAPTDAAEGGPGTGPSPLPTVLIAPAATVLPFPSAGPSGSGPRASPSPQPVAVATRITIPSEGIDLPIVSSDLTVPNQGPNHYPPCDVAIYHTAFAQPGQEGSTYIYAHARPGMFLPLLEASQRRDGASLVGDLVQVYTDDNHEYVYAITQVKRHTVDFSLAENVPPGVSQLVLQTSEGPAGTLPKLQILARAVDTLGATSADAHPQARPRACYASP
jgi:hypothetical protein